MARLVGMVHAMSSNTLMFRKITDKIMPGVDFVHLADEGLPYLSAQGQHKQVVRRLGIMSSLAKESGAEMVLLTCTAFGRIADEVQELAGIPAIATLEIVTAEALKLGKNIGILGSHPGAVETASRLILEDAALQKRNITITKVLCEGAFEAFKNEDWVKHDRIIKKYLKELMGKVEVIIAPQPSTERAVESLSETERLVPVISSARLSVRRLKEKLDSLPVPPLNSK